MERLKSKKIIEQLFASGEGFSVFPLRLVYLEVPVAKTPMQCAFSVSKRQFKKATDRNKIKRLLRESYRRQKPALYNKLQKPYHGMILFNGKKIPTQEELDKNMEQLLEKWVKRVSL
ncbi:MAG: ribonuclease P protein component [Flavobacteriaceae bacterium]|nr:ribonuclease P protein component [Flavobacteriaceae bacterium]MCI5087512.1 ribonuclease P protein component [Flavobacteriaceae bacterium]